MVYLVTGAAGFIGSNLSHELIQTGNEVVLVDRFSEYYSSNYKRLRAEALLSGFEVLDIDLANRAEVYSKLKNKSFETVFHLAAQPGVRVKFPDSTVYLRDNISAFANILEFSFHSNAARFLYASSSSVYENSAHFPFTESENLASPSNTYAKSKWINEKLAESFLGHDLQILGLRFFSAYGPWGRPDMSYLRMISSSFSGKPYLQNGDGSVRRDFTFIDDIVESLVKLSHRKDYSYPVVNIGGNQDRQMTDLIKIVEALTGKSVNIANGPISPQDLKRTLADSERLKSLIGYTPSKSLEQGIEETVDWARKYANEDQLFSWTSF